ncbi:hypothetical protein H0H87_002490 [Tephrocybe sp. NHM501043]|nr:hypothetical protein H0H87_002490 [Tephrocybe sp. NHM501043]
MGGFHVSQDIGAGKIFEPLDPTDIEPYLKNRDIDVSEEDILDRSKGDILAKSLVLIQVTWFIIQIMARAEQHLAITELEVVTLAFAVLNFITYFCWWNKPLDVNRPIKIAAYHVPVPHGDATTSNATTIPTQTSIDDNYEGHASSISYTVDANYENIHSAAGDEHDLNLYRISAPPPPFTRSLGGESCNSTDPCGHPNPLLPLPSLDTPSRLNHDLHLLHINTAATKPQGEVAGTTHPMGRAIWGTTRNSSPGNWKSLQRLH